MADSRILATLSSTLPPLVLPPLPLPPPTRDLLLPEPLVVPRHPILPRHVDRLHLRRAGQLQYGLLDVTDGQY